MPIQLYLSELLTRLSGVTNRLFGDAADIREFFMSRWLWCAALVLVISARALVTNSEQLFSGAGDTDDVMRLIQVREFLSHGGWFNQSIPQVGAPDTLVSHWSRLLDLPIAALIVLFGTVLSSENAELIARIIWPVALLFALTMVVFRETERRGGVFAGVAALLFIFGGLAATVQFAPGRIDHHNVQILCAVAGILFLLRSFSEPGFGWVAGGLLGLGLAVGLEALPLVVAVLGIATVCAAFDISARDGVVRTVGSAAAVLALTFAMTTQPTQWLHAACDANALNLIALASFGAAAMVVVMARYPHGSPIHWLGGVMIGGALGVGAYLAIEPACAAGPFGQVDPAIGPIWLDHVFEVKTLIHLAETSPSTVVSFLVFVMLGVAACWINWRQQGDIKSLAALLTMITVAVYSCLYLKLMSYAMWLAIVPVALLVARLPAFGELSERSVRLGAVVLCSQTMMLAVVSVFVGAFSDVESKAEEAWTVSTNDCQPRALYKELAGLPKGLVASEIDLGPFIALNSQHRVVAAPYHRIDKAILASYQILASDPGKSLELIRRLGVRYVVVCQRDSRSIESMIDGSLMRRLQRGDTISFLEPVPRRDDKSPLRIWQVKLSGA